MAEQRDLPGWPKKKLVKQVRTQLWRYGIRPQFRTWRATWSWASAVANSYVYTHWPSPNEIASQYILLLLAEMHSNLALRLPYRANTAMPAGVRQLLPANPIPLLTHNVQGGGCSTKPDSSSVSPVD